MINNRTEKKDPWNVFLEFEKNRNLFQKKNNQSFFFWDFMRLSVYIDFLWVKNTGESDLSRANRGSVISLFFERIGNLIAWLFWLCFKKHTYIFFICSRNKNKNSHQYYDQNAEDVLTILKDESGIIETYNIPGISYKYSSVKFNVSGIYRKLISVFVKSSDYSDLLKVLSDDLNLFYTNNYINKFIKSAQADYLYYRFVFKIKRPKVIFMTQNGHMKGILAAAKSLKIPIVEFQHGIIDTGHIAYNYCQTIGYTNNNVFLPKYFFTFSNFWSKDIFMPDVNILAFGNSEFNSISANMEKTTESILVVSGDVFGPSLKDFVLKYLELGGEEEIFFKLHPNEFFCKDSYIDIFSSYPKVRVITTEFKINDLIAKVGSIITIQSTAVYEALHASTKVFLLMEMSYKRHEKIFNNPNVYLINKPEELKRSIRLKWVNSGDEEEPFFTAFNNHDFQLFIKNASKC